MKRDKSILIRVSEIEKDKLKQLADNMGVSISVYIRIKLLNEGKTQ